MNEVVSTLDKMVLPLSPSPQKRKGGLKQKQVSNDHLSVNRGVSVSFVGQASKQGKDDDTKSRQSRQSRKTLNSRIEPQLDSSSEEGNKKETGSDEEHRFQRFLEASRKRNSARREAIQEKKREEKRLLREAKIKK